MRYRALLLFGLLVLSFFPSGASGGLRGRLSETVNLKYADNREFLKQETWFRLEYKHISQPAFLFSTVDVRYDPLFHTDPDIDIREAYVKVRMGSFDFRFGRQIVIWGKADEFNPTDFVNPEDYREFISLSKADRKIGIWYPRIEYYRGNFRIEVIAIPLFTPSEYPMDPSHPWMPREIGNLLGDPRIRITESDKPEPTVENIEYAFRAAAVMSRFDFSVCYFRGFTDLPVMVRTGIVPPDTVIITPSHKRFQAVGFDFSTTLRGWGFRGETAYLFEDFYVTEDITDPDGIAESPVISAVLGVDYTFGNDLYLNVQWVQRYLIDYREGISEDRLENRLVASGYRNFLYDELTLGFTAMIYRMADRDYLLHPYVSYSPADGVSIEPAVYLFGGDEESLFGQFDRNDCISLTVTFYF